MNVIVLTYNRHASTMKKVLKGKEKINVLRVELPCFNEREGYDVTGNHENISVSRHMVISQGGKMN